MSRREGMDVSVSELGQSIYKIMKLDGKNLLHSYLLKQNWKIVKPVRVGKVEYYPTFFKEYITKYDNNRDILQNFRDDKTHTILTALDKDFEQLKKEFVPDISQIHLLITHYFFEKLEYLLIVDLFALQIKTVTDILNALVRVVDSDTKKELRALAQDSRKMDSSVKYYTIIEPNIHKKQTIKTFEKLFNELPSVKINGISYSEIDGLEAPLSKAEERNKKRIDDYFRRKSVFLNKTYRGRYSSVFQKHKRNANRIVKRFMRDVYKYRDSVVRYPRVSKPVIRSE